MDKNKEFIAASLREALMNYLQGHPHAADTLEGITQWWLTGVDPAVTPSMIQQALDELILEKKISSDVLGDGSVLYFHSRKQNK